MAARTVENIRNIALVGHSSAGKTSLAEALLFKSGAIGHQGSIESGNTVCDFDPAEKNAQASLTAAVIGFEHAGVDVNIVDTPGNSDFIGHALSALPAADIAAVVVDARTGIEMNTQRMMTRAKERNIPRMLIVNKIDAEEANLSALVDTLRETFGTECLPINLPTEGGSKVVDCFFKAGGDADFSSVQEAHTAIVEQVVEVDEELMEAYLEKGDDLDPEQLHAPFERAMREGHLVPICFTSARGLVGVPELLDVMAKMLPNPTSVSPAPFKNGEEELEITADAEGKALAHVFKVASDPYVGKLSVFRIYRGKVTKETGLHVDGSKKPIRISHLFKLRGKEHIEISEGLPGDICAVAKIDEIQLHSTLHEDPAESRMKLVTVPLPVPMYGLAISPKNRGDEDKLGTALRKLRDEDPCFVMEQAAGETVVRGLGDQHVRVILNWMKDRYNVEVETRPPKIPYRETVTVKAEGHHRHKKQTGGAGQFGEVYLRIEPLPRGTGFEFENAVVGGTIPSQFISAVEKGVRLAYTAGVISGNAMQDVKVIVYDGKSHPVDSKEVAFTTAGKKAFMDAVQKARPIILEPIVDVAVTAPEGDIGTVTGDLAGLRGQIAGTDAGPAGMMVVTAKAPLSELSDFHSRLKSSTGGKGSYSIEFSHYGAVPSNVQKDLMESFKPSDDED